MMNSIVAASSPKSPGANGTAVSFPVADAQTVLEYIEPIILANLDAASEDLRRPDSMLSDKFRRDTLQRCKRFGSDAQQVVLTVQKEVLPSPHDQNGDSADSTFSNLILDPEGKY